MVIRLVFLLTALVSCMNRQDESALNSKDKNSFEKKLGKMSTAEVDTLYAQICRRLDKQRKALGAEYECANDAGKKAALGKARNLLLNTMADSLLVCWYGTGWDFNGTSTCPRQGNIACGYFVTTVLKQAGFNISRGFLAQQASSVMIRTFCPGDKVKTITNNQTQKLIDHLKSKPDGIFLLGLDNHTGFVIKKNGQLNFVHSNYLSDVDKVVCEPLEKSSIIQSNGFFVAGELLYSDETMVKWMKGEKIGND